jgi:hypothetical protein
MLLFNSSEEKSIFLRPDDRKARSCQVKLIRCSSSRNTHFCVDEVTRQILQLVQRESGRICGDNFTRCAKLEEESDFRSSHGGGLREVCRGFWEGWIEMYSFGKSFPLKFSRLSAKRRRKKM